MDGRWYRLRDVVGAPASARIIGSSLLRRGQQSCAVHKEPIARYRIQFQDTLRTLPSTAGGGQPYKPCSTRAVEPHQRPDLENDRVARRLGAIRTTPREDQPIIAHRPGVLLQVITRFRVQQHIVDPASRLGGAQQVVAVEISRSVDMKAGIPTSKH